MGIPWRGPGNTACRRGYATGAVGGSRDFGLMQPSRSLPQRETHMDTVRLIVACACAAGHPVLAQPTDDRVALEDNFDSIEGWAKLDLGKARLDRLNDQ